MSNKNRVNKDCIMHRKTCNFFCQYSKCTEHILCEKCVLDHIKDHPKQFIYPIQSLSQLHAFNKIDKLKQIVVANKRDSNAAISQIYAEFASICNPLTEKVKQFATQSRAMIEKELEVCLSKNKYIIEQTKIEKSNTNSILDNPDQMLAESINEVETISKKQTAIMENALNYQWYNDSTDQLCKTVKHELKSVISVVYKLLDNCLDVQINKYVNPEQMKHNLDYHQGSFYQRYMKSHQVALYGDQRNLEMQLLHSKNEIKKKVNEIKKFHLDSKEKDEKISDRDKKIEKLKFELLQWEQKADKEKRELQEAKKREQKNKEESLIKKGIIGSDRKSISLEKKMVDDNIFPLILSLVKQPLQLDLSSHKITKNQLQAFLNCSSLQKLKINFIPWNESNQDFLIKALKSFQNLTQLQLNSAQIDDNTINNLSKFFPPKIKVLELMDNKISDEGIEMMFQNSRQPLQSLYVSYNKLTSRSIEILNRFCYQIKVLHIAKNKIRSKGAQNIGKYLKELRELFIGGTQVQREGFLAICRNCHKLKKLSLVSNSLSTDIVWQIILGLKNLQWLDISYTKLTKNDMQKISQLKSFNSDLKIIHEG